MRDDRTPQSSLPALREVRGEVVPLGEPAPRPLRPGGPVRAVMAAIFGVTIIVTLSSLPEIVSWLGRRL